MDIIQSIESIPMSLCYTSITLITCCVWEPGIPSRSHLSLDGMLQTTWLSYPPHYQSVWRVQTPIYD